MLGAARSSPDFLLLLLLLSLAVIRFFDSVKVDRTQSWLYAACSLSYLGAMVSSNSALQFVNYPTQVTRGRLLGTGGGVKGAPWPSVTPQRWGWPRTGPQAEEVTATKSSWEGKGHGGSFFGGFLRLCFSQLTCWGCLTLFQAVLSGAERARGVPGGESDS